MEETSLCSSISMSQITKLLYTPLQSGIFDYIDHAKLVNQDHNKLEAILVGMTFPQQ